MLNVLKQLHEDESGQDIIEYVFIATFVGLATIATVKTVGTTINSLWTNLNTGL